MLTLSQTRFPQKLSDYITLYIRALSARKIIRILSVLIEKDFSLWCYRRKKKSGRYRRKSIFSGRYRRKSIFSGRYLRKSIFFQGVILEKVYFQGVFLEKDIF